MLLRGTNGSKVVLVYIQVLSTWGFMANSTYQRGIGHISGISGTEEEKPKLPNKCPLLPLSQSKSTSK